MRPVSSTCTSPVIKSNDSCRFVFIRGSLFWRNRLKSDLRRCEIILGSNPKSEILTKFQNLNPNNRALTAGFLGIWNFGFRSDFGFRIFSHVLSGYVEGKEIGLDYFIPFQVHFPHVRFLLSG